MKKIFILIILFKLLLAKTIIVYKTEKCTNGDEYYTTISEALSNVGWEDSHVIKICPGTYQENLSINKWYHNNITIESATSNKDDVTIKGKFVFSGWKTGITIQNLTIDAGSDYAFDGKENSNIVNSFFKNIDIISSKIGMKLYTIADTNFEKIKIRSQEEGIYIETQNGKGNFHHLDIVSENASAIFIKTINNEGTFNDFNITTKGDAPAFHIKEVKASVGLFNIGTTGDSPNNILSQNGIGIKIEDSSNDFNLSNTIINADKEGIDIREVKDQAYLQDVNISSNSTCISISQLSKNIKIDTNNFTYNKLNCKKEGISIGNHFDYMELNNTWFDINPDICEVYAIKTSTVRNVSIKNSIFDLNSKAGGIRLNGDNDMFKLKNSKFRNVINEAIYVNKINNDIEIVQNVFTPGNKDSDNECIVKDYIALKVDSGSTGGNIKSNMFNKGFDYMLYFTNGQDTNNTLNVLGNCFYKPEVYTKHKKILFYDSENEIGNFWSDWNGTEKYLVQDEPIQYYDEYPLYQCPLITIPNNFPKVGLFDAWDTFRDINDRNISTKIVNKEFDLIIASINKENSDVETKENISVDFALYDKDSENYISSWYDFNCSIYETIKQTFNVSKAYKEAIVVFNVCADYNGTSYTLYPKNECSKNCNPNNRITFDNPCFRKLFSSDEFAIRPKEFDINIISPIKAGEEFNIIIRAIDATGQNTKGYNEKIYIDGENNASVKLEYNSTKNGCKTAKLKKISGDFIDGEAKITLKYPEVGELNIKVKEINRSEFAKIDSNDTNDLERLIKDSTNKTILFIPYEINISEAKYTTTTNTNWVYIGNDVKNSQETNQTPKMGAHIYYKIESLNKDGNVTKNFKKSCFPDFNLSLYAYLITSKDVNISIYVEDNNKSKRVKNYDKNATLKKNGLKSIRSIINANNFNDGISKINVYFNINKNYSHPIEEVDINLKELNISSLNINSAFNGKKINRSINFKYGRIKVSNKVGYSNEINSTFEYQYWTQNGWEVNKEHINSNFGDFNHTLNPDLHPYIRIDAFSLNNGKENVKFRTTHPLPYSKKVHLQIDEWLWYHPLAKDYKDPSKNNLDCLTHPCFKLNFLKEGSKWGGVSKNRNSKFNVTNRTIEINNSKDLNITRQEIKKLNW